MASSGVLNPDVVSAKVKSLMNNQLKTILKKESLPVSGAKAAMQTRIINRESYPEIGLRRSSHLRRIHCWVSSNTVSYWISWQCRIVLLGLYSYGDSNDVEGFSRLRSLVYNPDFDPNGLSPSPSATRTYPSDSAPEPSSYSQSFSSSTRNGPHNMAPHVNGTGPSM